MSSFRFGVLVAVILSFSVPPDAGVAAEEPGRSWRFVPELSDEFNGPALDASKWRDHPGWPGRPPAAFDPANVEVRDGMLRLTARLGEYANVPASRKDAFHTYTTAHVSSQEMLRYGYVEIRARPMDSRASSAFWLANDTKDEFTEIDVFEISGGHPKYARTVFQTAHVHRAPGLAERIFSQGRHRTDARLADGFRTYAMEWTPDALIWYVDGRPVRRLANTHWHQPLRIIFDSETFPYWFGLPAPESLPSSFEIDYIRVFKSASEA